jgi:membrane-associated phospholipid phosphatase
MTERLAKITTVVLNPFLVSLILLVMLAFESTMGIADAFKWLAISIALSVLPTFVFVIYMVRMKRLDGLFENPRNQRNLVYLLAVVLGITGAVILYYANAPRLLFVTFVAGLSAMVIFMLINMYWKISLHTGFIAAAAAVLIIVYGAQAAWSVLLVPLVGWARLKRKMHSFMQVTCGIVLAAGTVVIVFAIFGML